MSKVLLILIPTIILVGCSDVKIEKSSPSDVSFFIVNGVECIYAGEGYKHGGGVTCNWDKYNKQEVKGE